MASAGAAIANIIRTIPSFWKNTKPKNTRPPSPRRPAPKRGHDSYSDNKSNSKRAVPGTRSGISIQRMPTKRARSRKRPAKSRSRKARPGARAKRAASRAAGRGGRQRRNARRRTALVAAGAMAPMNLYRHQGSFTMFSKTAQNLGVLDFWGPSATAATYGDIAALSFGDLTFINNLFILASGTGLRTIGGSTVLDTSTQGQYNLIRVRGRRTFWLQNQSNAEVHMAIYYCKPKMSGRTGNSALVNADTAAKDLTTTVDSTGVAANTTFLLNRQPQDSTHFCEDWKVVKKKNLICPAAGRCNFSVGFSKGWKVVDSMKYAKGGSDLFKDLSTQVIIKIWGQMVVDATDDKLVSTAAYSLSCIYKDDFRVQKLPRVKQVVPYYWNQSTTGLGAVADARMATDNAPAAAVAPAI